MQASHHQRKKQDNADRELRDARAPKVDPAVEHIRRRLLRLMIVSLIATFLLIGAVLAAVIYKITRPSSVQTTAGASVQQGIKTEEIRAIVEAEVKSALNRSDPEKTRASIESMEIRLPAGTRILSQSVSEGIISLETLPPKGGTELIIYDYREGRIITRLRIEAAAEKPQSEPMSEETTDE